MADTAHGNLLRCDRDHLFWNEEAWHHIKRSKQKFVVPHVRLPDIVRQNLLLLWILLEVLFESSVTNQLLLELEYLLLAHSLVAQCSNDILDPALGFGNFWPDHRQTLDHVVSAEAFSELTLQ